jgi:hypothetical protein
MVPHNHTVGNPARRKAELYGTDVVHRLKSWPEFFEPIRCGIKKHDLRRADDRVFKTGDKVLLEEYDPETKSYTGRNLLVRITYITSADMPCALSHDALHQDFCILSISPCE